MIEKRGTLGENDKCMLVFRSLTAIAAILLYLILNIMIYIIIDHNSLQYIEGSMQIDGIK